MHAYYLQKSEYQVDSIAVSVFVVDIELTNTESETNPNNNLMMSRGALSSTKCLPIGF